MARQLQSSFTGTVGNLTFYKLYNQYYVRTKSSGGLQTEATKRCQQPFGLAATIAANLRRILHPAIPNSASKEAQNRLSTAVLQWLRSQADSTLHPPYPISEVQGFQFISQTSLQQLLLVNITVQTSPGKGLTIHLPALIPSQHIKAPKGTNSVQIKIASGSYCLRQNKTISAFCHTIEIPYTSKVITAQTIATPLALEPHQIIATAISVSYKIKQPGSPIPIPVQQHQWQASSIIDIRCC